MRIFGNACIMLITNDFVFKENLVIQSLKFTLYLIRARFFKNFLSYYIFILFHFISIFILLNHRTKFLKINFNFLGILVNDLQSDNKQKRRKAASTSCR